MVDRIDAVWVFNGPRIPFPSAVFSTYEAADDWIRRNALTGVLTKYPVDTSVYEWAIDNGYFTPKKEHHTSSAFIENFSSANQEHYHYKEGAR